MWSQISKVCETWGLQRKVPLIGKRSVSLGEEVLEVDACIQQTLPGIVYLHLLFSSLSFFFQWSQLKVGIVFGCKKQRHVPWPNIWNKNPFRPFFADSVSTPSAEAICPPMHWEAWLEVTLTSSFFRMTQLVQPTSCSIGSQACPQAFHLRPCICFSMRLGSNCPCKSASSLGWKAICWLYCIAPGALSMLDVLWLNMFFSLGII